MTYRSIHILTISGLSGGWLVGGTLESPYNEGSIQSRH